MGSIQIKGGQIVDSAIIAVKLAANSVTSAKIVDGAVGTSALGAGAVTSNAISASALDNASFFAGGVISTAALAADCVTADKIGTGAVVADGLGNGSVVEAKIGSGAITSAKIGAAAVQTAAVGDNQITNAKLAGSIAAAKLNLNDTFDFTSGTLKVSTPANATDAANKSYVDAFTAGLSIKANVRVASSANIDITDIPANIDSVSMSAGNRVLLFGQTTQSENGVYVYTSSGSAMARSTDMDTGSDFPGAFLFSLEGSFDNAGFVCINDVAPTLGNTNVTFQRFTGLGSVTVSGGLQKAGDDISIANSGVTTAKIADGSLTSGKYASGSVLTAAVGNAQITQQKLSGDSVGSAQVIGGSIGTSELASDSVTNVKIDNLAVSTAKLQDSCITAAKVATGAILTAAVGDDQITNAKLADDCVDSAQIANGAINDSAMLASNVVTQDKLASSSVSSAKIASGAVGTSALAGVSVTSDKLADSSVTAGKLGITFAQEAKAISGASTTTIDLLQTLGTNETKAILVFKNGLNIKNMTALGDTASDNDEYTVSGNGGASGKARLTFGQPLDNADNLIIWYYH
jgi:hypothetical protein